MDKQTTKIKLLLVDDEEEFREVTSKVLARRGFEVHQAESGEQALELVEISPPGTFDIILLDLKMDGMDGIATLQKLRGSGAKVPVIILTGHGSYQDALSGIKLDIVDFLQKPVDIENLGLRIHKLLAKHEHAPLRERTVSELMVPVESYRRVYDDEPVAAAVKALQESFFHQVTGKLAEQGHRTVLVYDRSDRFVGLIRIADIVRLSIPPFLRDSPYASYFTGMFLAHCKTLARYRVGDLVRARESITPETPLMEAVNLMISNGMINLPVMRGDSLVGLLRDKDLLLEMAAYMLVE